MIGEETIERIRERASIASIIGESVKLERRGRSLVGLCPFHKEKTPSFHVNEERGRYHCFGCQASGDVFRFIQEVEGLTFIEAVKRLGEKVGVTVEDDLSDQERRQQQAARRREQALYELNATAASFFEKMLVTHPERALAHAELERRELSYSGDTRAALEAFRIGYAPPGWDELAAFLRDAGHDLRAAEQLGLVGARKQGGGYYDRFRNRLMFAVIDLSGRVVAFSGRALPPPTRNEPARPDAEPVAKYINSPESVIYKKRAVVFGLFQARAALRDGTAAVLVEGNFDVMSLHARGIARAVAPLGTAFTLEQGRAIRRFTNEVVLLFDGDRAGREATLKAREPAQEAGLSLRVAQLPEGTDPDEFVRQRGSEGLLRLVAAAKSMLDHRIGELLDERFASDDTEARGRKLQRLFELLAQESDPAVRAMAEQYADQLASRLGVADARTFRALRERVRSSLAVESKAHGSPTPQRAIGGAGGARRGRTEISTAIIGALLDFPELLDTEDFLAYSDAMEGDLAAVVACLRRAPSTKDKKGLDLVSALANLPETVRPFVEARVAAPLFTSIDSAKTVLQDNALKLRQMEFARLKSSAISDLEKARRQGDIDQEEQLLRQQQERARRRRGLE